MASREPLLVSEGPGAEGPGLLRPDTEGSPSCFSAPLDAGARRAWEESHRRGVGAAGTYPPRVFMPRRRRGARSAAEIRTVSADARPRLSRGEQAPGVTRSRTGLSLENIARDYGKTRRLAEQPGCGENAGNGHQSQRFLHDTSLVFAGNQAPASRTIDQSQYSSPSGGGDVPLQPDVEIGEPLSPGLHAPSFPGPRDSLVPT